MKLERRGRALQSTPAGRQVPICRIEHVPPDADPAVLHQDPALTESVAEEMR